MNQRWSSRSGKQSWIYVSHTNPFNNMTSIPVHLFYSRRWAVLDQCCNGTHRPPLGTNQTLKFFPSLPLRQQSHQSASPACPEDPPAAVSDTRTQGRTQWSQEDEVGWMGSAAHMPGRWSLGARSGWWWRRQGATRTTQMSLNRCLAFRFTLM